MSITASDYVKKIEAEYAKAREKWAGAVKKLDLLEAEKNGINKALYTTEGMNKIMTEYREKKKALRADITASREAFKTAVASIKSDCKAVFNDLYRYTPADIDTNGLAILEHGGLSEKELAEMAEKYRDAGNATMFFIVAEKLKDSPAPEYSSIYAEAKRKRDTRPDIELLERYEYVCMMGLRDDIELSNGVHSRLQAKALADAVKDGESIKATAGPFD